MTTSKLPASAPITRNTPARAHGFTPIIPTEIPEKEKIEIRRTVGPKKAIPENSTLQPVPVPIPGEAKATFKAACLLAHQIYCDLATERRHYRTKAGDLLPSLDSVIQAIINETLETGSE